MFKALIKKVTTKDRTPAVKAQLQRLAQLDVFVGIPQADNVPRGDITNAELLFIQEHGVRRSSMINEMQHLMDQGHHFQAAYNLYVHEQGSPLWRIPPRPVLGPAIASVKPQLTYLYLKAVHAALRGQDPLPYVEAAGARAQWAAQEWFTDPRNHWTPNAPSTIAAKGSSRPLIDTGLMRRSIKYVVRKVR